MSPRLHIGALLGVLSLAACGSVSSTIDGGEEGPDGGGPPDATVIGEVGPVTDFAADGSAAGPAVYSLSWTNPNSPDLAGVLILRSEAPASDAPVDGTAYVVGDTIGSSTVVFVGTGTSAEDLTAWGGHVFTYSAFAFNVADDYSDKAEDDARAEIFFRGTVSVSGTTATITPDLGSGGLDFTFAVTPSKGTALTTTFTNLTDRHFYNAKFTVSGANLLNSDGTFEGQPIKYYGPVATLMGTSSPTRDIVVDVTGTFTFEIELARHPMVAFSHNSGTQQLSLVDTGRNVIVGEPGPAEGFTGGVWFSTVSRDGRFIWASENYGNGVVVFDQSTGTVVRQLDIAPLAGGSESYTIPAGIAASLDESTLYVATSMYDGTIAHLYVVRVNAAAGTEIDRLSLYDGVSGGGSQEMARGIAIDHARNRLYVPNYGQGRLHVIDLATFTQLDTDGDGTNGVTPVVFGSLSEHLNASGIAIDPDGTHAYVSFGRRIARTVAELNLDDLATISFLPLSFTGSGYASSPGILFAPDGRLFVPRTQYPQDDVTSFGISVYDLSATPVVEQGINILGSMATYNNDLWDVAFVPGTTLGYGVMADAGDLFLFDWTTLQAIDGDGDASNGHTNISTIDSSGAYGGSIVVTPY